jgi:phosphatidylglycerophosphatase A
LAALAIVLIVGVAAAGKTEKDLGIKDPSCVVIDEVLGMGVALLWVPRTWPFLIMGLVLFRIFDIWKPPPIKKLEKLPGGWGIMLDDLLAGLYACLWLHIGDWLIRLIA